MRYSTNSRYYPLALYLFGLITILFFINYFHYLVQPGSGLHFWRQADSISFAAYYYENGMDFFQPGTYNTNSNNGMAASEFPILYYITAAVWHIVGRHDIVLKLINSAIVFTGFYCLFKIAYQQIKNIYIALLLTLLLLSSTTLLTYTNNFIPDPPSLGLSLIGGYFFSRFIDTKKYYLFNCSIVFLTISILIKPSMAALFLTIVALVFIECILRLKLTKNVIFNGHPLKYITPLAIAIVLVTAWIIWVKQYNAINNSYLFLTSAKPYWNCDSTEINNIYYSITQSWMPEYYYFSTLHVFFIVIIAGLLNIKKWQKLHIIISLFLVLGTGGYFILFFKQFAAHDYYMIPVFVPLAFLTIFSYASLIKRFIFLQRSLIPIVGLLTICILSYNYSRMRIERRSPMSFGADINEEIFEITGRLQQFGIPANAEIISIPDKTPNGSLYYLQRKGHTNWANYPIEYTYQTVNYAVKHGISYMVISHPAYYRFAQSSWYSTVEVGHYKNIRMYKFTRVNAAP